MNKLLLLSRIKRLIFVFKSSTECNVDFVWPKKDKWIIFCSRFKIYAFMVSTLTFASKITRPIIFSAVKFSTVKEFFHSQRNFPQLRKFSTVKKFFHSQGNYPHSRNFSTVKEFFHSQRIFPQKFFTWSRKFSQTRTCSTVNETFHKKLLLAQGNFPQNREVLHNIFFLDQGSFLQTKIFFHKQRSKTSSKS